MGHHLPRLIVVPLWNEKQLLAVKLATLNPHSPSFLTAADQNICPVSIEVPLGFRAMMKLIINMYAVQVEARWLSLYWGTSLG